MVHASEVVIVDDRLGYIYLNLSTLFVLEKYPRKFLHSHLDCFCNIKVMVPMSEDLRVVESIPGTEILLHSDGISQKSGNKKVVLVPEPSDSPDDPLVS